MSKIDLEYKWELNDEQKKCMMEMILWTAGAEWESFSTSVDSYNIKKKTIGLGCAYKYYYINYLIALLFLIPRKLGMEVVVVDTENPNVLFDQVYEKYRIANNIPEKSIKKPKYKSTDVNKELMDEDFYNFCSC